jgi:hypothetical protein
MQQLRVGFPCAGWLLVAFLISLQSTSFAKSSVGINGGQSHSLTISKKFTIPHEIAATDDKMNEFEAVSSHGRGDDLFRTPFMPSNFQILTRALYLFLLFSPMAFTSGLAYFSSTFRTSVWYGLMRYAIAHGGAVSLQISSYLSFSTTCV